MNKGKLKIAIVTGSRAEYGLFKPLLQLIKKDRTLQLQLLVTGMHLSPEFGLTYQQIEHDGFQIDEKVEMLLSADTDSGVVKSTAIGMMGMADAIQRLQPDWVVLLGDRFETFAAAFAAHQAKIPVAHLHGGELTEGATDDAMRHAITKMSYLHFASTEIYRRRIIQLGESPNRVFNVGAIGLDSIRTVKLLSRKELEKQLNLSFAKLNFLVTFHPVTLEKQTAAQQVEQLLRALDRFKEAGIIITMPNADAEGRIIMRLLEEYSNQNPDRVKLFTSLGQLRYLSVLQQVQLVIGNSSSGIIEVPEMHIPTINIGNRQEGRVRAKTVIDCGTSSSNIIKAITKSLSAGFQAQCKKASNPYSKPGTAPAVLNQLKKYGRLSSVKKKFYDLK